MRWSVILSVVWIVSIHSVRGQDSLHWESLQKIKKGSVTVYWFPNEPFGFEDQNRKMQGIEVEILLGFRQYLKEQYQIDLTLNWKRLQTFKNVMDRMKYGSSPGIFGLAGFSFTDERRKFMKFSPSYMADVAVLVSTQDIPIVRSREDLKKNFSGTTALTAQGTTLEKELIQMREENQLDFNIEYTVGSEELIKVLRNRKKSFGYLSLPIYLMDLDKGNSKLNRQNFLTKKYEGRGIGLPLASDWEKVLEEYFENARFKNNIQTIIGKYVNIDLYHFVETMRPENEVSLLNTEKSMQSMQLKLQQLTIQDKNEKQIYLISIIVVVSFFLVVIAFQFRRQRQSNRILQEQKSEIEAQADHIKLINDNLERLIDERTKELQNKNKALEEYAFITAHKLRSPLSSILGLVTLIEKMQLPEQDKVLIQHLGKASKNLDGIIHSAMDAIDRSGSLNETKIKE